MFQAILFATTVLTGTADASEKGQYYLPKGSQLHSCTDDQGSPSLLGVLERGAYGNATTLKSGYRTFRFWNVKGGGAYQPDLEGGQEVPATVQFCVSEDVLDGADRLPIQKPVYFTASAAGVPFKVYYSKVGKSTAVDAPSLTVGGGGAIRLSRTKNQALVGNLMVGLSKVKLEGATAPSDDLDGATLPAIDYALGVGLRFNEFEVLYIPIGMSTIVGSGASGSDLAYRPWFTAAFGITGTLKGLK